LAEEDPKDRVLGRIEEERALWRDLVEKVGEDRMEEPGPMGDWSFKDLASHLLGWRNRSIARYEAAAADRPEPSPPWPADLDGDEEINPWIREQYADRSVRDVLDDVDVSYVRLARAIDSLPIEMVVEPNVFAWLEGDSIAQTELFGHLHDEHEPSIREWLATRAVARPRG
jgi:hypothetical protein